AGLDSPNLTIGDGPARLLVVAVATGNPAAVVRHITWSGAALTRLDARVLAAPAGPCRLELWTLIDPASGASSLQVSLSASAGFGLGAVVYTGVDAEEPLGPARWQSGSGGRIALDVPAPGERPVLGAACLGGHWHGGPRARAPRRASPMSTCGSDVPVTPGGGGPPTPDSCSSRWPPSPSGAGGGIPEPSALHRRSVSSDSLTRRNVLEVDDAIAWLSAGRPPGGRSGAGAAAGGGPRARGGDAGQLLPGVGGQLARSHRHPLHGGHRPRPLAAR